MTTQQPFFTRALRWFYGIEGPLDEYKMSELNKTSSRLVIAMWCYHLAAIVVAAGVYMRTAVPAGTILISYLVSNLVFNIYGVAGYIAFSVQRKRLAVLEVAPANYAAAKARIKRRSICQGIFAGVTMYLWYGWQSPQFTGFMSLKVLIPQVFNGIFFGIIMYFISKTRLKKCD